MLNALWRLAFRLAFLGYLAVNFFRRPTTYGSLVAIWHEDRLLLIRNSYRRDHNLPGGFKGRHEDPAVAAARELREELGLTVSAQRLRFAAEITGWYEFRRDHTYFYELEVDQRPEFKCDEREVVWAGFVDLQDALSRRLSRPVRQYLLAKSAS
jgi:8-oxo-dGTP diphosphatase